MATYILLAPVLFLLLGAILILFLGEERHREGWDPLPLLITALAFVASLLLHDELPVRVALSSWRPLPQFRAELVYYADGLALPWALLMTLLTLAAILSSLDRPLRPPEKKRLYAASFFLSAAGLSLVLSANLITLCLSWALLDLGICALIHLQKEGEHSVATRAFAINGLTGMALLAAALMVSQSEASVTLAGGVVPPIALSLIVLAALVRMGFYPLHLGLPLTEGRTWSDALYRLIPASAGTYLLVRAGSLARESIPLQGVLLLLGCLTMVASATLAWGEAQRSRALSWVAIHQISTVVLAMGLGTPPMTIVALLQAGHLVLAMGLLFLGQEMEASSHREALLLRAFWALAVASLLGLPPSLGFVARWAFYRHAIEGGAWLLTLLSGAANALILTPLLSMRHPPASPGRGAFVEASLAGLSLLGLPIVILGVQPRLLIPFVQTVGGAASRTYLARLISGGHVLLNLEILIAILWPLLLGYGLYRARRAMTERGEALASDICSWMEWTWLYRRLWRGALRLGTALGSLMSLLEGRSALAWIALLALAVALLIVGG